MLTKSPYLTLPCDQASLSLYTAHMRNVQCLIDDLFKDINPCLRPIALLDSNDEVKEVIDEAD